MIIIYLDATFIFRCEVVNETLVQVDQLLKFMAEICVSFGSNAEHANVTEFNKILAEHLER